MLDPGDPDLKSINPDLKHIPAIAKSTRIIKSASVFHSVVDPDPGSGSVLDPYSIRPLDPDPDP